MVFVGGSSPQVVIAQGGASSSVSVAQDTARDGLSAWRARAGALTTRAFATLWTASPAAFRARWDSAYVADTTALRTLGAAAAPETLRRERIRLALRHAWGRTVWPYFHWREGDATAVVPDATLPALLRTLPIEDSTFWSLPEHVELTAALVHERARTLLARDARLRRGDAQWLRAEFAATLAQFRAPALRRTLTTRLLLTHLDENDERGVDSIRTRWRALRPDTADVRRVDSAIVAARALRTGHAAVTYTRAAGVPLELHVLRPTGGDTSGARPAMLWFHGGSATTGSWSQSPGVTRRLRENGVTVIAVEYRTGARFDAKPVDQYEDAAAAFTYARAHAAELGIDPARIGAAGFSSGAVLALQLVTRGVTTSRPALPSSRRAYPAAAIVTGACTDPAGPNEDGWFRKTVAQVGKPADYAPIDLVSAGQPPMLLVHATRDEYCSYDDAKRFVDRARTLGVDATLESVDGATHFFGFYFRQGQEQMRRAIADALTRWGWR